MKKYKIEVSERLSRIIEVEANTDNEAIEKIRNMYNNEEIVLDIEDFCDNNFEIIEITDLDKKYNYETIFILKKDCKLTDIDEIIKKVKRLFDITKIKYIGTKKLAYDIKGNKEGFYVSLNINGYESFVPKLEKYYRENDNIIKFITIKMED